MSKIIIEFNGKSVEIDRKELQSEGDVRVAMMKVINSTENVTDVLASSDAIAPLLKAAQEEREKRNKIGLDECQKFCELYNNYVNFRKDNNIANSDIDLKGIPKEIDEGLHLRANLIAFQWNKVKELGFEEHVKQTFPKLKPFLKSMDKTYKEVFGKKNRKSKG